MPNTNDLLLFNFCPPSHLVSALNTNIHGVPGLNADSSQNTLSCRFQSV